MVSVAAAVVAGVAAVATVMRVVGEAWRERVPDGDGSMEGGLWLVCQSSRLTFITEVGERTSAVMTPVATPASGANDTPATFASANMALDTW